MMRNLISRMNRAIHGAFTQPGKSPSIAEAMEVPRYPAVQQGLVPASAHRLLKTQAELLDELQNVIALPIEQYERLMVPVLVNFAAYVQLLPASEYHHHSQAGGLLRHSLEVSFWATRLTKRRIFERTGTPLVRDRMEPRWRVATALAGLLHDLGKVQTDMVVTDAKTGKQWHPFVNSLWDWAVENRVQRYVLRFVPDRHQLHERIFPLMLPQILTPEIKAWLSQYGNGPSEAIVSSITGVGDRYLIYQLVGDADKQSVSKDLATRGNSGAGALSVGVAVHAYLIDTMKYFLAEGVWKVNEPGARVWVLEQGVFVVWAKAVEEILAHLRKQNVPGLPSSMDTLADILIERGYALSWSKGEGVSFRTWPVLPDMLANRGLKKCVWMLRMANPEILFGNVTPSPVGGVLRDEVPRGVEARVVSLGVDRAETAVTEKLGIFVEEAQSPEDPSDDGKGVVPLTVQAPAIEDTSGNISAKDDQKVLISSHVMGEGSLASQINSGLEILAVRSGEMAASVDEKGIDAEPTSEPPVRQATDEENAISQVTELAELPAVLALPSELKPSELKPFQSEGVNGSVVERKNILQVLEGDNPEAAEIIREIVWYRIQSGNNTIFVCDKGVVIFKYPEAIDSIINSNTQSGDNRSFAKIMAVLKASNFFEPDILAPNRIVTRIGDVEGMVAKKILATALKKEVPELKISKNDAIEEADKEGFNKIIEFIKEIRSGSSSNSGGHVTIITKDELNQYFKLCGTSHTKVGRLLRLAGWEWHREQNAYREKSRE